MIMSDDVKIPVPGSLQEIVGSLLFASQEPLGISDLREAVRSVEAEEGENHEVMDVYRTCTTKEIEAAVRGVEKALEVAGCGFRLVCAGGAYRLQTVAACGRYVRAMLKLDRPARLGRASLETLAIVAYRQPITKGEVEEIRGVDVTANLKTLMDLQLVRMVGKSELPGHPFLYGTTPLFLEHFGLANLAALNELDPTLQRSNPKLKAASYRKPAEAKKADESDDDAKAPTGSAAAAEANPPESEIAEPEEDEVADAVETVAAGDDIFIDDTPDEFDEEDDEDDEGEEDGADDDCDGDDEGVDDDDDDEDDEEDDDETEDEDEE